MHVVSLPAKSKTSPRTQASWVVALVLVVGCSAAPTSDAGSGGGAALAGGSATGGGEAAGGGVASAGGSAGGTGQGGGVATPVLPTCEHGFCFEHPLPSGYRWNQLSVGARGRAVLAGQNGRIGVLDGEVLRVTRIDAGDLLGATEAADGGLWAVSLMSRDATLYDPAGGTHALPDFLPSDRLFRMRATPNGVALLGLQLTTRAAMLASVVNGAPQFATLAVEPYATSVDTRGQFWAFVDGGVVKGTVSPAPAWSALRPLDVEGAQGGWVDSNENLWALGTRSVFVADAGAPLELPTSATVGNFCLGGLGTTAWVFSASFNSVSTVDRCTPDDGCEMASSSNSLLTPRPSLTDSSDTRLFTLTRDGRISWGDANGLHVVNPVTSMGLPAAFDLEADGGGAIITKFGEVLRRADGGWAAQSPLGIIVTSFSHLATGERFVSDGNRLYRLNAQLDNGTQVTPPSVGIPTLLLAGDLAADTSGPLWKWNRTTQSWDAFDTVPTDGAIVRRISAVTVASAGDVWVALVDASGMSGGGLIAHRAPTGTWSFVRAAAIANVTLTWIGVSPTGDVWATGLAAHRLSNGTVSTFPVAGEITGEGAILPDGGVVLPLRAGFAEWNGQGFVAHDLGTPTLTVAAFAGGRVWLGGDSSVILSR